MMKYYIRNYSNICLRKKPFKQKIFVHMRNQIFKINTIEHENTKSGELCILKSLDNFKIKYKNQFACFLIKCIFCYNLSLYINKITGNYKKLHYIIIYLYIFKYIYYFFRLVYLYTLFKTW